MFDLLDSLVCTSQGLVDRDNLGRCRIDVPAVNGRGYARPSEA